MDLRYFRLQNLIPVVDAQSADASAQPTFGTLDLGGGPVTGAVITLTADATAVNVGQTFSVDIDINTGDIRISEYRIIIDFNTNILSVVDAEPGETGTQISFQDPVFSTDNGQNTVSNGRITLIANTPQGNALQVNRSVATINFQVQAPGSTTISIADIGTTGTQLINQDNIAIPATLNSVTVVAGSATTSATSTATTTNTATSSSPTTGGNNGEIPPEIPRTGIGDDFLGLLPLLFGVVLVALGLNLRRVRKRGYA